jgi:hypothetical protein
MKFLFKLIVLPILTIVAIPAIFLALAYSDVTIPVEDFEGTTAISLSEMINEEFDSFLVSNTSTSKVGISVAQSDANALLKSQFLSINPQYLDENAPDDKKNYVVKEDFFGYQGSWIRFKEDVIEIESGAHVFVSDFTYKTSVLVTFKITVDTKEIVLKLDKLNIGNIPLAWTFSTANWVISQVLGEDNDIKTLIDEQLGGLAEFDLSKREIRVSMQSLVDNAFKDNPQDKALVNSLLAFVEENDLLDIGFKDESFGAFVALGKTKDDTDVSLYAITGTNRINEAGLQDILTSRGSALIFSLLSSPTPTPFIELDQFTLNRMFEYFMRGQQVSEGVLIETELFEGIRMRALVPYITMDNNAFKVNIPLIILNAQDDSFQTIIKINALPEIDGSDLKIVLNELSAGEVVLGAQHISNILLMLGDNDLIKDGAFVIENFDQQMSAAGLSLESVDVVNSKLRLYVSLGDNNTLIADIQNAVQEALNVISNLDYDNEDLNQAIDDLVGSLLDPEADPEAAVENLLAVMQDLTDAEQQQLYDDLLAAFEDTDFDFNSIFNLVP